MSSAKLVGHQLQDNDERIAQLFKRENLPPLPCQQPRNLCLQVSKQTNQPSSRMLLHQRWN
jgi:hypothetical protein